MKNELQPILLYDGHCALCNAWVRVLLALDSRGELRFAKLQSEFARRLLLPLGLDPESMDTVVLLEDTVRDGRGMEGRTQESSRAHLKSDAILHAVAHLGSPWKYLRYARHFPRGLRDRLYDYLARHRYAWFGRHENCPLPKTKHRSRFLDLD